MSSGVNSYSTAYFMEGPAFLTSVTGVWMPA